MYEEYFRLSDAPFRLNPDPRFFYGSRSHNKAMAYLHYGLKQAEGFIVITGPVGAGKSMVIGHLLDQLNASNIVAANLLTSNIEPEDLLSQILSAFRIEPEGEGRTGEIEAFEDYLFDQLNRGRRVLLIIDEAQNLPFKTLEELRMLSNIDYEGTPLFQVFLVGQPEFRTIMEQPDMEQLRQRVIASYHLETLSEEETRDYILHRLAVAGWREDPTFTAGAFKAIHEETLGLPRRINTLCNRLMLYCSLEEKHEVTAKVVATVCAELKEEKLESRKPAAAMPPVAKIEEELPDEEAPAEESSTEEHVEDEVVSETVAHQEVEISAGDEPSDGDADEKIVSLESERARMSAAAQEPEMEETVDEEKHEATAPSSMSVLDRLRAKKDTGARHEATLTDVASAIRAASEGAAPGIEESSAAAESDLTDATRDVSESAWRSAIVRSIDETREELKRANSNVVSLSRSVSAAEERRKERRSKIAASLGRAEALLDELRSAEG
ncbi:XrtA/PEP-CTERM system-associated ATPase [Hyphococcus sp.]|uniref:XrtA/PEP-CTERM system-associated ATPase n=1 Tax=Hyphococcus sp. TaxID=2038636 RepID=UPI003D0E59FE